ncbi:MAG: GumC family protein [Flavobacteriaceae bacterium]
MNFPMGDRESNLALPMPVAGAAQPDIRVVDLRSVFGVIWRGRRRIVAFAVVFALLAAAIALAIPSRYEATASLLVDPRGVKVLRDDVTDRLNSADTAIAEAESQVGMVRSNDVLKEVVRRAGLADDPEFGNPPPSILDPVLSLLPGGGDISRERLALRALDEAVFAGRSEMTYVIDVTVTTQDPEKSAKLANMIAEVYLERVRDARAEIVRRSSTALEARLQELRDRVTASERRVEDYRKANDISSANGQLVVGQQLQELTQELSRVEGTVADLETRYGEVERLRSQRLSPESLSESLASQTISGLRNLLAEARSQLSTYEVTLGARHPQLLEARANVAQIEGQIRAELDRIAQGLKIERDRAIARRDVLRGRIETLKSNVYETNDVSLGLEELQRQAKSDRDVYEAFLSRASELSEQESVDTSNARVISAAVPPLKKSWPPRSILTLAAALFGGMVGVGYTLLREQFNPTVIGARQIAQDTGLPVLAEVSRAELAGDYRPKPGARGALDQLYNRIARTPEGPARWVFVSAVDGDRMPAGAALAFIASAAESGDRLLVVDADTRAGHLTRLFGLEGEPGLAELLQSGDAVAATHVISDDPAVHFVPRGGSEANGRALQWPMRKIVNQSDQQFDMVLVNGGDLWSSRTHRGLVAAADSVILMAELAATRTEDISEAARSLSAAGARVGGVVLVV